MGSKHPTIFPVFSAFLFVAVCVVPGAYSQSGGTSPTQPVQQRIAYEIISITPGKSGIESSGWRSTPNGMVFTNVPLSMLVRSAYTIIADDQLSGLPGWADSDRYDIQAKMDEDSAAAWKDLTRQERERQQKMMIQALLADRCGLKVHRETKQLPVYNLVVAKGGLKIKEAKAAASGFSSGNGMFEANSFAMESLVYSLSNNVGRVVIDKTGLGDKKFDFKLKWTPDDQQGTTDAGPSIYAALEEQLGLKLVAARGPVEIVVVDHMDKPSPN